MTEELIDIVDKNDNLIGKDTRRNVHNLTNWHRGIHVLILNSKNEMLLPIRSKTKDKYPSTYDTSISEHVSSGETFDEAAQRGLKEELNITNPKLKKLIKFRMRFGKNDNMINTVYACQYDGKLTANKEEVASVSFLPLQKIKSLLKEKDTMFPPWTSEILKWYFKMPSKLELIE
jgi:isopentenyl-diphosphate delta-isomerase type 1